MRWVIRPLGDAGRKVSHADPDGNLISFIEVGASSAPASNSTIEKNGGDGIDAHNTHVSGPTSSDDRALDLDSSTIARNDDNGVRLRNAAAHVVDSKIVTNTLDGIDKLDNGTLTGLDLKLDVRDSTISKNKDDGISARHTDAQVLDSTIDHNAGNGIFVSDVDADILGSTIVFNRKSGIRVINGNACILTDLICFNREEAVPVEHLDHLRRVRLRRQRVRELCELGGARRGV